MGTNHGMGRRAASVGMALAVLFALVSTGSMLRGGKARSARVARDTPALLPAAVTPSPSPGRAEPAVETCWSRAKTPQATEACAHAESDAAEREHNDILNRITKGAEPGLRREVEVAEAAWIRYRDAYLSSFEPSAEGGCLAILRARVTRGRIGELARMTVPRQDAALREERCEFTPVDCRDADAWQRKEYEGILAKSPLVVRERVRESQDAWRTYASAQAEATLARLQPQNPSRTARIRESIRVRLSLDRKAHLQTLAAWRTPGVARCEKLRGESRSLAELAAGCDSRRASACASLGHALKWGWYGIDRNHPKARSLFLEACELGDARACSELAFIEASGQGVPKNAVMSAYYKGRGCAVDDAASCQSLALAYADGKGVPRDVDTAVRLWQRACELSRTAKPQGWYGGHPCEDLAAVYQLGKDVPQDIPLALAYHEKACEAKYSRGCLEAARLLRMQTGFDVKRVSALYRKACSGFDYLSACVEAGDMFREGKDVSVDTKEALGWYEHVCSVGFVPGCHAAAALTGKPSGDPDDPIADPSYIKTVRLDLAPGRSPVRLRLFGDDFGCVLRIDVFREDERRVIQTISVPDEPGRSCGGGLPVTHDDLDFDGYQDLRLRSYSGANNFGDLIWIYRPAKARFEFCRILSDLPNLRPDPKTRTVVSLYHSSAAEGSSQEYRWIVGKPVLVRQLTATAVRSASGDCLEREVQERRHGRLVVISRVCE